MENADKSAYPVPITNQTESNQIQSENINGLTKREVFAMSAMNGILAGNDYKSRSKANQISACQASIEMADELLKQLNPAEINK